MMATGNWDELAAIAPRTKNAIETCAVAPRKPVLGVIPASLSIPSPTPALPWASLLDVDAGNGVVIREVVLRWLLTRAIVDQGSDLSLIHI